MQDHATSTPHKGVCKRPITHGKPHAVHKTLILDKSDGRRRGPRDGSAGKVMFPLEELNWEILKTISSRIAMSLQRFRRGRLLGDTVQ
jgi:hypothetical protein